MASRGSKPSKRTSETGRRLVRAASIVLGGGVLFAGGLGVGAWLASGTNSVSEPAAVSAPVQQPVRSQAAVPLPAMTAEARRLPVPAQRETPSRDTISRDTISNIPALNAPALNVPPDPARGAAAATAPSPSAVDRGAPSSPGLSVDAWRRHAVAVDTPAGAPMIAIVLDDLGIDKRRSARAMALPAPLTLAFLSYADDLDRQTAVARANGHELLMHIPMQPHGHNSDPGPNVLDIHLGADAVAERLAWNLARFDGYVGVNNHMGSAFTESEEGMRIVAAGLQSRGLLFLDSLTSAKSVALRVAEAHGVPATARDVFLDNTDTAAEVELRLAQTERVARQTGTAIAIGHPRDATLNVLTAWIAKARDAGFALVPLTAVLEERRSESRQQASRP